MRIAMCLLAILAMAAGVWPSASKAGTVLQSAPQIHGIRLKGKKLLVSGTGFDMGAVILVNGERQKTANDDSDPTGLLIGKKAGRRIGPTDVVTVQVVNADDMASPFVKFFGGLTITQADAGTTIELSLHQQFLVALDSSYEWSWSFSDPAAFSPVPVQLPLLGVQGVFEADVAGQFTLTAKGDPACSKSTPPCEIPSKLVEVKLVVR